LASAAQLGVSPERCWYVGDSTWDMQAAAAAGMVAIGVVTGAVDAAALVDAGADVATESLTVVLDHLRGRGVLGTL
jgi:phosphoglycolate phosphatase